MQNVSDNSLSNIDSVPQLRQISLPSDVSLITSTQQSTSTVISGSRDSYSCFINELSIDINANNNTSNGNTSLSHIHSPPSLMPGSSSSLILTLDSPNMRKESATSPIPPLIMPSCQNGFSQQQIIVPSQEDHMQVDNIRQSKLHLGY